MKPWLLLLAACAEQPDAPPLALAAQLAAHVVISETAP